MTIYAYISFWINALMKVGARGTHIIPCPVEVNLEKRYVNGNSIATGGLQQIVIDVSHYHV